MALPFEVYFEAMAKEYERVKLLPNIRAVCGKEEDFEQAVFEQKDKELLSTAFVAAFNIEQLGKHLFARSNVPERKNIYFSIINCAYRCKNLINKAFASIQGNGIETPHNPIMRGNFSYLLACIKGQTFCMLTAYDKLILSNPSATRCYLFDIELCALRILAYL